MTQEGLRKTIRDFNVSDVHGRNFESIPKTRSKEMMKKPQANHSIRSGSLKQKNSAKGAADTGGSRHIATKKVKRQSTASSHDRSVSYLKILNSTLLQFNQIEIAPDEVIEYD